MVGTRRSLRIGLVVMALAFGAAGSGAASRAATAGCEPSPSEPLLVTNFGDNPNHPAKGTLRYILEDVVKPGQTIRFCSKVPVDLNGALTIPSADKSVTLDGAQISAAALRPTALNIDAPGLRIENSDLFEVRVNVDAPDVRLTGDTFRQTNHSEAYLLLAEHASGLTIGGKGAAADTFASDAQTAIAIQLSNDVSILGNTITTGGGGRFAVTGADDAGFTMTGNTTDGDAISEALSGTISGNTFNGPGGAGGGGGPVDAGKHLTTAQATAAARRAGLGLYVLTTGAGPVGHLEVEGNHVNGGSLDVERPNVTIAHNIVTGGTGMGVTCGYPDEPSHGPLVIAHNELTGTAKGLRYRCRADVAATLDTNRVMSGREYGMFVVAAKAVLQGNVVTGNRGRGIDVECPSGSQAGSLTLKDNTVADNGTGITYVCDNAATVASLDGSIVTGNRGAGITIARAAGATAVTGGKVQGNHAAGIQVSAAAHAAISHVAMGGNTGVGISSPAVPPPVLAYKTNVIKGLACANCLVEVFSIEGGAREGNPRNGEGASFRGDLRAGADGRFVYPAKCDLAKQLTFTATRDAGTPAATTSGFSTDVDCMPPELDVYAQVIYTHNVNGKICIKTVDSAPQRITDPTDSKPVYYEFYVTMPTCHGGTTAWSAIGKDHGKTVSLTPAFEPDTTVDAVEYQTCISSASAAGSNLTYPPPCRTGARVQVEVINHRPDG